MGGIDANYCLLLAMVFDSILCTGLFNSLQLSCTAFAASAALAVSTEFMEFLRSDTCFCERPGLCGRVGSDGIGVPVIPHCINLRVLQPANATSSNDC